MFHRACTTIVWLIIAESQAVSQGTLFKWHDQDLRIGQERLIAVEYYHGRLSGEVKVLDSLQGFLQAHPDVVVEIGVHSDSRGTVELNQRLTESRSRSVRAYLVAELAVDPEQVFSRGYGESHPMVHDDSIQKLPTRRLREAAHQANQRTFVKIVALQRSCEIERVRMTHRKSDSVGERDLFYLFRTYSPSCMEGVEFMEFSNETLFNCLGSSTQAFLEALANPDISEEQRAMVLGQLSRPVNDGASIEIPQYLITATDHQPIRDRIVSALQAAAKKQ